jgi:energy-converting hydrogenase Eha subunit C
MTLHLDLLPVLAVIAGIAILIRPRLLNYIVAFYLIAIGLIQIFNIHI